MIRLSVVYFGTPDFSARFLQKIFENNQLPIDITAVVTQEDKKIGRKLILTQSPVKKLAAANSKKVFHDFPTDKYNLGLVFSYGRIIPRKILDLFKFGVWIVHPSILPKYRGASPIAQALIDGEKETGVTLIIADEGIDTGEIIGQKKIEINLNEKRDGLTGRLVNTACELFEDTINEFINNGFKINTIKQEKLDYPITKKFKKEDGYIPFDKLINLSPSDSIMTYNRFRGLYPWPGIWTKIKINGQEKRLKIIEMEIKNNKLLFTKVQLEGKKEVDFNTFNLAYKIFI